MADKIRVSFSGLVRNALGIQEEELPVADGMRVRDLIDELWHRHGNAFAYSVLNRNGSLRANAQVFLDNRDVADMAGLDTKLEDYAEAFISVVVYPEEGG